MNSWDIGADIFVFVSACLGLTGTNAQARLAKQDLMSDEDASIVAAGRLWQPWPVIARKRTRQRRAALDAEIRTDPARWARYQRMCRELRAWNALESAVVLALGGTVYTIIGQLTN